MNKILVVSTGSSINKISKKLNSVNYDILSWGNSLPFLLNNNCEPKYWSFIDPHSSINSFNRILQDKKKINTKLLLLQPIVNTSFGLISRSIGRPGKHRKYDWKRGGFRKLNKQIEDSKNFIKITPIETKTFMQEFGASNKNYINKLINLIQREEFYISHIPGVTYEKLTTCVLPLVYHLGYKDILLAGFDGYGSRYNNIRIHKTNKKDESKMQSSYDKLMPFWAKKPNMTTVTPSYLEKFISYEELD